MILRKLRPKQRWSAKKGDEQTFFGDIVLARRPSKMNKVLWWRFWRNKQRRCSNDVKGEIRGLYKYWNVIWKGNKRNAWRDTNVKPLDDKGRANTNGSPSGGGSNRKHESNTDETESFQWQEQGPHPQTIVGLRVCTGWIWRTVLVVSVTKLW